VLEVPVILAVNCWDWELSRITEVGLMAIETVGTSVTVALAELIEPELKVAVMVTVCTLLIFFGAV